VSKSHGPAPLKSYVSAHEGHMKALGDGLIIDHDLQLVPDGHLLRLLGHVALRGGVMIKVYKTLQVWKERGELWCVTIDYEYNVFVQGRGNVFRYDNADHFVGRPGFMHADEHHKHLFDPPGRKNGVQHVGKDDWPHLSDVIKEAHDWWVKNDERLCLGHEAGDLTICRNEPVAPTAQDFD
jgi:hypothetical protein